MRSRLLWLGLAVLLVGVVAAVILGRGCRERPPAPPADFVEEGVRLVSPDLELALVSVRGIVNPTYTDWACFLECREARGCRAEVKLVVDYRSNGEERTLKLAGRLDGDRGETMRIGRAQRPPTAVDRIDRVTVEVVSAGPPPKGAARPTPMQ